MRIRVASRRGDAGYFANAVKGLSGLRKFETLAANPLTGSVLFSGSDLDTDTIAAYARAQALFDLRAPEPHHRPLMHRLIQPVEAIDRTLSTATGGAIDLPSGIFLALLAAGVYELARGRFSAPPWYTAFWYALGLASMYAIGKAGAREAARQAD